MIIDGRYVPDDSAAADRERERIAAYRRQHVTAARVDRLANHWNNNMPEREKRALLALALTDAEIDVRQRWSDLPFDHRVALLNAFRRAVEFGMECARALHS